MAHTSSWKVQAFYPKMELIHILHPCTKLIQEKGKLAASEISRASHLEERSSTKHICFSSFCESDSRESAARRAVALGGVTAGHYAAA